eukprot:1192085-Prorocentrum_minimum.AAC.1
MAKLNVDKYRIGDHCSLLPLALFDNTEYESRTHDEWVDPDVSGDTVLTPKSFVGTPAMAARFAEDGECAFVPARVKECTDKTANTYKVYYEDNLATPVLLPR